MSQFVEVKTTELTGPALDWCVCMVSTGAQYHDDYGRATLVMPGAAAMMNGLKRPRYAASVPDYSSDWALGGPLLDEYDIALNGGADADGWVIYATLRAVDAGAPFACATGKNRLIAACRAIVRAMQGDVVQVPAELMGVAA